MMQALVGSGGFLLAVLWFDLMFDVQVIGLPADGLPEEVLASISAYYHRVTTTADPMGKVVGLTMLFTVVGAALQLRNRSVPPFLRYGALVASVLPVTLAVLWIVPDAVRLGTRVDPIPVQSRLAHSILRGHVVCFASILTFCIIQIRAVSSARRGDASRGRSAQVRGGKP
jgi:hypothetical protein